MAFEHSDNYMNTWIEKCNSLKKKGELEQNSAMKSLGKLLANSSYGQSLKRDQNDIIKIASTY